jgi:hypothetical protein
MDADAHGFIGAEAEVFDRMYRMDGIPDRQTVWRTRERRDSPRMHTDAHGSGN